MNHTRTMNEGGEIQALKARVAALEARMRLLEMPATSMPGPFLPMSTPVPRPDSPWYTTSNLASQIAQVENAPDRPY